MSLREKNKVVTLKSHGHANHGWVDVLVRSSASRRAALREQPDFAAIDRGVDQGGQATKGVWGMPRRQEAMKGVEDCDKPGGLVKRELIPGFPN